MEPIFRLMATWTSRPTPTQLASIREISPILKNVPDSTLLRNAVSGTPFELGRFNDSELRAIDLDSRLVALGIRVEKAPIPGLS